MTEDHHCKNINNINLQNLELQHSPVYAGIIDFRENKYLAKCVLNEDHIQKNWFILDKIFHVSFCSCDSSFFNF